MFGSAEEPKYSVMPHSLSEYTEYIGVYGVCQSISNSISTKECFSPVICVCVFCLTFYVASSLLDKVSLWFQFH